jgi:predicted dehydrogenase
MQRFQGGGKWNESRWGVKPLSHTANSVIPLGPVRDTFSSCATVDGDTPVPVEYAVLDTALESPRVRDYEVKSSVWPNVRRLHVRTFLTLTGGGPSELLTVDQRDMPVDEFDEFAACVRGDRERKAGAAERTAVSTVAAAALGSIAPEPTVRLR